MACKIRPHLPPVTAPALPPVTAFDVTFPGALVLDSSFVSLPLEVVTMRTLHRLTLTILCALTILLHTDALQAQSTRDASPWGAGLGAVAGGLAGTFIAASTVDNGTCDGLCSERIRALVIGDILGATVGAHLGNRGRGNVLAVLGVSAAFATVGTVLAIEADGGGTSDAIVLSTVIIHLAGVTWMEVRTSPLVSVEPVVRPMEGGLGVGVRLRW